MLMSKEEFKLKAYSDQFAAMVTMHGNYKILDEGAKYAWLTKRGGKLELSLTEAGDGATEWLEYEGFDGEDVVAGQSVGSPRWRCAWSKPYEGAPDVVYGRSMIKQLGGLAVAMWAHDSPTGLRAMSTFLPHLHEYVITDMKRREYALYEKMKGRDEWRQFCEMLTPKTWEQWDKTHRMMLEQHDAFQLHPRVMYFILSKRRVAGAALLRAIDREDLWP